MNPLIFAGNYQNEFAIFVFPRQKPLFFLTNKVDFSYNKQSGACGKLIPNDPK